MDSLHFCIAVVPLSVYLLMMGLLNLRRHPFVTTGARDAATLGIGVVGFVIAGPMELFFPEGAASQFGGWVWVSLIVFYGLCVSLVVLLMRPRLVVYNVALEELRPILSKIAMELDPKSRWIGDALVIPRLKVHMHLEAVELLRNVQMLSGGNQQSMEGWLRVERELKQHMAKVTVGPNVMGIPFLIASGLLAVTAATYLILEGDAVHVAWDNFFRR